MPPITTAESQAQEQAALLKERRFKLSRACDRCRRRRIKCDEGHPCQACLTASTACTFEEPGKRSHPHKSKRTATLEDRMHHLETLIQAIPQAVFAAGSNVAPSAKDPHTSTSPLQPFQYPQFPTGVPPPSLNVFPLMGPSAHFPPEAKVDEQESNLSPTTAFHSFVGTFQQPLQNSTDQLTEDTARMSLSASYLYFDDEGYTRWQGETSGLPLLDLLLEKHAKPREPSSPSGAGASPPRDEPPQPQRMNVDPRSLWKLITTTIPSELMDSLVQCYLSTSYYILPFLHVPTFLADYGNPQKWGEPGFASFIVAICCLASRHTDDPRVRANPADGISAGTQWFDLLNRLRTLPIADRPTLYTIQGDLLAAVYAVGLGRLSRAASLLSEAVTTCIDAGLHRSADTYDLFNPIEDQVRKRTFWCVYIWDKQLGAHFGRPPMIRLRDCDVGEPAAVDDEFITKDKLGVTPPGVECRLTAFICSLRVLVVLESVLDVSPPKSENSSSFMARAASVLARKQDSRELREEEMLLDEIHASVPPHWAHSPETLASEDPIRLTQAERLYTAEHFVRLLIYRHRFSQLVADRFATEEDEQTAVEKEAMIAAHHSALQIITAHLHIAKKGLMTYYGVHVIHQLTQAGRTLVAILLNCKTEALQHLIPSGLDALRSCVGLLRRFSGRYVCGLRSGDLMEEFCQLTQIPLEMRQDRTSIMGASPRPPWIRPVRKKTSSVGPSTRTETASQHSSPDGHPFSPSDFLVDGVGDQPPQPQHYNRQQPQAGFPPIYNDLGMDMSILRDDPEMYMSMTPSEVMALFNMDINPSGGGMYAGEQYSGTAFDLGGGAAPEEVQTR